MLSTDLTTQFNQLKAELVNTIKKEITLKLREEVQTAIVQAITQKMEVHHTESMNKMDHMLAKMDTHHAEAMTKQDQIITP